MISRLLALCIVVLLSPLLVIISLSILFLDGSPILFVQKRIGKKNTFFNMYKFRTMKVGTPDVATHLLKDPESFLFPLGSVLRRLTIDELPNLINIVKGDMFFIGPRPALYNQDDLMNLRRKYGIDKMKPGLSGLAQINGRDELSIEEKVELEKYYLKNKSFLMDIKILLKSFNSFLPYKNHISH